MNGGLIMAELKPCCEIFIPFVFDTCLFGKRIKTTILCCSCGKQASGRTFEKAVKKWNTRTGGADNATD